MKRYLSFCLLFFCVLGFAQMHTYDYKQEIKGAKAGEWKRFSLPELVYAKLKSEGNDLRIYGITTENDTIEVPYILDKNHSKTELLPIPFQVINQSRTSEGTFLTLKNPKKEIIDQIELTFENQNFDRKITLEGSNDQNQWFTLLKDYRVVAIKNESVSFVYNTLKFNESEYLYYRIFIPDPSHEIQFASATVNHRQKTSILIYEYESQFAVNEDKKHKETWVRVQLNTLLPISTLRVLPQQTHDYFRPIRIGYEDSIQTRKGWQKRFVTIASDVLTSQNKNIYDLSMQMLDNLVIRIDNQDNEPLQIKAVEVYGTHYQVTARFPEKQADYFLVYGKVNDYQPDYDISRFMQNIPADIASVALGGIERLRQSKNENTVLATNNKNWLWGIVVFMVVLLFYFSFKMLREKK
ncbi:hypothetical protein CGC54_05590 [Capnocytophaga canimorsus]|uniref:DUF3999 domain-containing protein n=1 Tax=Capnocytophaga canimorsus TaxID=28188 RepID=A0AAC9Z323_9FLAO|nr:DUF3999 family protein [Capnocytophaga canimorsus]ATA93844.1 hypothetical protein CGC54_05590 [Capnocytophaga canimorsus]